MVGLRAFVSTPGVRLDVVLGMEPEGFVQAEMSLWPFGLVLMGKCEGKKASGQREGQRQPQRGPEVKAGKQSKALCGSAWLEQRVAKGWDKVRLERQAEPLHTSKSGQQSWEVLPTHTQLPGTPAHVTRGTSSAKQPFPASLASPALCGTWCHLHRFYWVEAWLLLEW